MLRGKSSSGAFPVNIDLGLFPVDAVVFNLGNVVGNVVDEAHVK